VAANGTFQSPRWFPPRSSVRGFYAPRVAVICPVKGIEPGLEQNLAGLAGFDYPQKHHFTGEELRRKLSKGLKW
jgi:hypothetical protein